MVLSIFRNGGSSNKDAQINSSDIQSPSSAPSSSGLVTSTSVVQLASSSPSVFPIAFPTEAMLYERPSELDCEAIAKNQTIAGRNQMVYATFSFHVEVVLSENAAMTEPLLNEKGSTFYLTRRN